MKKIEKSSSAATEVESSTNVHSSQVCQPCAKHNVVRSFLVLTYAGIYVDRALLHKGIYGTTTPKLYSTKTTIKSLIHEARIIPDLPERYFENLSQCTLSEVLLFDSNICLSETSYKELRKHVLKIEADMRNGNYNAVINEFPSLLQKLEVMRSVSQ
jgi:hypothetical protein